MDNERLLHSVPVLEKMVERLTKSTVPTIGKVSGCAHYFSRRLRGV